MAFRSRDQSPVESADQPLFQFRNFARRAVGAEDDLLLLLVQRVEGVKEFLLRAVSPAQEMDVVDDQHVHVPIAVAELLHVAVLDGLDELVDEAVAAQIKNPRFGLMFQKFLADCLKQMAFAEPDTAMNEQRVVGFAGLLGDRDRRRVRQTIAWPGHKIFKRVIGIQRQGGVALVEHTAPVEIFKVKGNRHQPAGYLLRRLCEGLLALALAEIQLRRGCGRYLDDAVRELFGRELVKPDPIEARVLISDGLEYLLPDSGVENRLLRGVLSPRAKTASGS